jgi:hypothetical protein
VQEEYCKNVLTIADSILISSFNWFRPPKNISLVQWTSQSDQLITINWGLSIKINRMRILKIFPLWASMQLARRRNRRFFIVCRCHWTFVIVQCTLQIPKTQHLGRCFDHNVLRFWTFFGEKNWRFSQKPM